MSDGELITPREDATPVSRCGGVVRRRACPIDSRQLLEVITSFLAGRRPGIPSSSVCMECKRRGTVCVMVAHGTPCLGPVTHAGCGAICPAYHRGCYGCFGPKQTPNTGSLVRQLHILGMDETGVGRVFHTFNTGAEAFRDAASSGHQAGGRPFVRPEAARDDGRDDARDRQ